MSCLDNMKPIVLESSYGIYCGDKHSTEPSTEKTTNYGVTTSPESRYKNPRAAFKQFPNINSWAVAFQP